MTKKQTKIAELQPLSDEELMQLVTTENHSAFSELVRRHSDKFYAVAYRSLFSKSDAEDTVQDAFIKLWNKPKAFNAKKGVKFTTWFYRVVVNACYDRNKKRRMAPLPDNRDIVDLSDASEAIEHEQRFQDIEQALINLPERQRMAINLCFYEELSRDDAARAMGIGIKALESLLMRGKAALRENLVNNKEHQLHG